MGNQSVMRDERTTAVENASYRLAYIFLSFGVLLATTYRGFLGQSGWDLLALVIISSGIATLYQWKQQLLERRVLLPAIIVALCSAVLAALLAWFWA